MKEILWGNITAISYIQNFIQYSFLMLKSICRWNYWRS